MRQPTCPAIPPATTSDLSPLPRFAILKAPFGKPPIFAVPVAERASDRLQPVRPETCEKAVRRRAPPIGRRYDRRQAAATPWYVRWRSRWVAGSEHGCWRDWRCRGRATQCCGYWVRTIPCSCPRRPHVQSVSTTLPGVAGAVYGSIVMDLERREVFAISTQWSSGQVEGKLNCLKAIKRQMYGRAKKSICSRQGSWRQHDTNCTEFESDLLLNAYPHVKPPREGPMQPGPLFTAVGVMLVNTDGRGVDHLHVTIVSC